MDLNAANLKKRAYGFIVLLALLSAILGCDFSNSPADENTDNPAETTEDDDNTTPETPAELSFSLNSSSLPALRNGPGCNTTDLDGDGDMDVLLYGENIDPNEPRTLTYLNDGSGNFSIMANEDLEGVSQAASVFADLDNDGDQDLCISGEDEQGSTMNYFSAVYLNTGDGTFEEGLLSNIPNCKISAIVCGDLDGDGYIDLIISGAIRTAPYYTTTILINQGVTDGAWNGMSLSDFSSDLPQLKNGSLTLGDIDKDGDLDLLITGVDSGYSMITSLFTNNGDPGGDGWDGFTDSGTSVTAVESSDSVFEDIDGDSDLDIIIAGASFSGRTTEIWINNGAGSFSQDTEANLTPVSIADIIIGDPDSDGDADLIISGYESDAKFYTRFYRNDGSGTFVREDLGFTHIGDGNSRFFDADGDGDLDFINTGEDDAGTGYTELYMNNITN